MRNYSTIFLMFIVMLICFIPKKVYGQSNAFQIAIDSTGIFDFAVGPDSNIYVLKVKINLQLLKFEVGVAIINKNGQIIRSGRINLSDEHKILPFGNKILCNKDGSIYLIINHSNNQGVSYGKLLVHLDSDFKVLNKFNNIVSTNNTINYFITESDLTKSRIGWFANIEIGSNTLLMNHNLIDNKYSFEKFDLSSGQNGIILRDAAFIDEHSFLIHSESLTDTTLFYTLTKFNNTTKNNTIHRFNFEPYSIISDKENNLILLGKTKNREIIISKYTNELKLIWSKKISLSQNWFDYLEQKSLVADQDGNIYVNLQESILELNRGTKLLKLDKNGIKIYHKLLLDATHNGVNRASLFDNHLLFLVGLDAQLLRKLSLSGDADDCLSIPVCTEIEDFDAQIYKTDYNLVKIGETIPTDDIDIIIEPDYAKTYHYCEPFLPPNPLFNIFEKQFCKGDTLTIDTSLLYRYGLSEWTLFFDTESKVQSKKYPDPFILDKTGRGVIQHKLLFGGCEYLDTIHINVVEPRADLLPKSVKLCENDIKSIILPINAAKDIKWSNGTSAHTLEISQPGLYTVDYKDVNGCHKSESLQADQIFKPKISLMQDVELCNDSILTIDIPKVNDESIRWSDGTTQHQKLITEQGLYTATASNECGEASDDIYVTYKDCGSTLFYSNVFSPNGDNNNDQFVLIANNVSKANLKFYDRWGSLVFEGKYTAENMITWDGKSQQKPLIPGVYVFVLSYTEFLSGKEKILSGNTTVIY